MMNVFYNNYETLKYPSLMNFKSQLVKKLLFLQKHVIKYAYCKLVKLQNIL